MLLLSYASGKYFVGCAFHGPMAFLASICCPRDLVELLSIGHYILTDSFVVHIEQGGMEKCNYV
jgi:hypothetical protein